MLLKSPDLAGSWYPADESKLTAEVERCLRVGEKKYGLAVAEGEPVGVVVPHAGLSFSGPLAAVAYKLLRDALGVVDTFVVFGACHRARLSEPAIWLDGEWDTPLGPIEVDGELARLFVERGVGGENARVHYGDNAIELQTPFIRYLFPGAKLVPVAMSSFGDSWRFGELASRVALERGGRVVVVGSTDLTHYGEAFGVMPAGRGVGALEWTRENDGRFLAALTGMRVDEIVGVGERDGSACGAGAAAAVAGWACDRGCSKGRVLGYTNSYEVMPRGEAEHFVGYASVVFEC